MAGEEAPPRTDEKIALVLGAGGARGFAQIGVIEALEARRMNVVAVSGSSSGALVGGIYAAGKLREFREELVRMGRGRFLRLLDPALGKPGILQGGALVDAMKEVVGDPLIETLPKLFTAVAVDLQRHRVVWLRNGPLWDALRASFAIPGLFTPHEVDGRALVDGGLLAPLPITATRLSGAHRLVAVDMHSFPDRPPGEPAQPQLAAHDPTLMERFGGWFGKRLAGDHDAMGIVELMSSSLDTMQAQIARVELALDPPELVIRIPRDACQFYEFWRAAELIEIGRAEAEKALDAAGY
ncbi:MAG: serine protease [Lysobacteraceae bacterium]|nr:MAG: serine protease [Xanthomonadaceae bacterium]